MDKRTWGRLIVALNPGITQAAIGAKYQMRQSLVGRIINGGEPMPSTLERIAKGEGKRLSELVAMAEEFQSAA